MKSKFLSSLAIMTLISLMVVSAFGVSSPYWEGNPLEIGAGETEVVTLNLQNIANTQNDVTAEVKITDGSEIASVNEELFTVKAGSSENCFLTIKVPNDAEVGGVYKVKVETKTVTSGDAGMVAMGTGMTTAFDVVINGESQRSNTLYYIIGAVLVAAIAYFIIVARKK